MICCQRRMECKDSRLTDHGIRRRRVCTVCGHNTTTIEVPVPRYSKDLEVLAHKAIALLVEARS